LTTGVAAVVDAAGTIRKGPLVLGWRIRSGDAWLVPGADVPVRRSRPHPSPVVHSAVRVPGGDAIERVYAVDHDGAGIVVAEIENDSPEAIAVAFAVDVTGEPTGAAVVDDDGVRVDGALVLAFARRAGAVENGLAVFPVPHRTKVRVALTDTPLDVRGLADVEAVERAWDRVLDRGLRTELPEPLQSEIDGARADLLLAPASAEAFVALEAWGLDAEAAEMWARLPMRARHATRRARCSGVLGETLDALIEVEARTIALLPGFRTAWLGAALAAHDVPLREGTVSFALRWHGARPALLWDVPAGFTVRAPALDPAWSSSEAVGETLLAEPPTSLLALGDGAALAGTNVDAPEQFS
jgi:hypothetical protein